MYQPKIHEAASQITIVMLEPSVTHLTRTCSGVVNCSNAVTRRRRSTALKANRRMVSPTRTIGGVDGCEVDSRSAAATRNNATMISAGEADGEGHAHPEWT